MDQDKADRVIAILDAIDKKLDELRTEITPDIVFRESPSRSQQPLREIPRKPKQSDANDVFFLDFDDSQIEFKQKDGAIAGSYAQWGWAFGFTREGDYHEESRELVQAIEQYGKVQVGKRIYELKGRDGNLLNFKKVK